MRVFDEVKALGSPALVEVDRATITVANVEEEPPTPPPPWPWPEVSWGVLLLGGSGMATAFLLAMILRRS